MRGPIPGLVVSTMQSLNGGREPGHKRYRRRGRMMRGDAAAVTGAVPAVSLAATPFQLLLIARSLCRTPSAAVAMVSKLHHRRGGLPHQTA